VPTPLSMGVKGLHLEDASDRVGWFTTIYCKAIAYFVACTFLILKCNHAVTGELEL